MDTRMGPQMAAPMDTRGTSAASKLMQYSRDMQARTIPTAQAMVAQPRNGMVLNSQCHQRNHMPSASSAHGRANWRASPRTFASNSRPQISPYTNPFFGGFEFKSNQPCPASFQRLGRKPVLDDSMGQELKSDYYGYQNTKLLREHDGSFSHASIPQLHQQMNGFYQGRSHMKRRRLMSEENMMPYSVTEREQQRQFFDPDMLMRREIMQWTEDQMSYHASRRAQIYGNHEMGQLITNPNHERLQRMKEGQMPYDASFASQRSSLRAPQGYIIVPVPSRKGVKGSKQPRRLPNGMACLSCRLRKVRCSGTRPCLQCLCRSEACQDAPKKVGQKKSSEKKSEGTTNLRHPEQQSSVASISSSSASLSNAVNGRVKSQVSSSGSPSSISGNGLSSQMRNGQNMSTKNEELSIEETRNLKRKL
mmetsp:Transcript_11125/g.17957  ORF Transcript_11125/g.17957 Transcript_11125/m.17957 type:complete len:420 (-) Transcript_11125:199-1458(-)